MRRVQVGAMLVAHGHITEAVLEARLVEHRRLGVPLGRVLMVHGDVTRQQLWDALGATWGLETVDLMLDPPERALLDAVDPAQMLSQRWVPHHIDDGSVLVAVCDEPSDDRAGRMIAALAAGGVDVEEVHFAVTTDWDIEQAVLAGRGDAVVQRAAYELADQRPELSAADPIVLWQRIAGVALPALVAISAAIDWRITMLTVVVALNLLFMVGVAFRVLTSAVGLARVGRREHRESIDNRTSLPGSDIPDRELPVFTVLVPAYGEANVVADVVANMAALDYPMSRLQVLLLLEADDIETIEAAKRARPPDFVRIVVVPSGGPKTKPKACNVGLALAEGEFLVIYDAEDRPEPGQLREVVQAFRDADDDVVCVQARLNYFNTSTNILTRMFTLEYSLWFDAMVPGLDALRLPIPLGGTSNHFRTGAFRDLGGWDPFNVTEDADLGVRATALHKRVGIVHSTTWEEACSEWKAWIRQRTRWIKGYMVTALVQLRNPFRAWQRLHTRGMVGLVGLVAGTPLLFLAAPPIWALFLATFLGLDIPQFHLPVWLQIGSLCTLVFGNLAMIILSALGCGRRKLWKLAPYALIVPAYWVLHSIAAWRALFQLVRNPSHWEKTPHGIEHGPEAYDTPAPKPAPTPAAVPVPAAGPAFVASAARTSGQDAAPTEPAPAR